MPTADTTRLHLSSTAIGDRVLTVGSWPGQSYDFNPFIKLFCRSLELAGAEVVDVTDPTRRLPPMDILHIHWPDWHFWMAWSFRNKLKRCVLTILQVFQLKRAGAKVVWMVHDLQPLQPGVSKTVLWKMYIAVLSRMVDGFMTLSAETAPVVRTAYPVLSKLPSSTANHPLFQIPNKYERNAARSSLSIDESSTVFTFFGIVRRPKGVLSLAKAFAAMPGPGYRLIIAGKVFEGDQDYADEIWAAVRDDCRVTVRFGYVEEDDAARIAAATDAFVLPFDESLHSSSLIYSLSSGRGVITPDAPYSRGVDRAVGPGWVTRYQGALTAEILQSWRPPTEPANLEAFSLSRLGEEAMSLYSDLVQTG